MYNLGMIVLIPWSEFTIETVTKKVNEGDTCMVVKDGKPIIKFGPPEKEKRPKIKQFKIESKMTTDEIIIKQREEEKW